MAEIPERIYAIRDADGEPDWSTFEMTVEERERLELFGGWESPYVLASTADRWKRERDAAFAVILFIDEQLKGQAPDWVTIRKRVAAIAACQESEG